MEKGSEGSEIFTWMDFFLVSMICLSAKGPIFQARQSAKSYSPQFPYLPWKSLADFFLVITYTVIMSMDDTKLDRIKISWKKEELRKIISADKSLPVLFASQ